MSGGRGRQLSPTDLKRLHRGWRHRTAVPLALVLDGVQQPFNVGGLVRTAAAYRVDDVWVAGATLDLDAAAVGKASMGSERFLRWARAADGAAAVAAARAAGYRTVALELADGAVPLFELGPVGPTAVVLGHEDHGIAPATLEACDVVAYLPLVGRIGSLNVAAAGAAALAELRRQEWTTTPPADGPPAG